MLPGNDAHHLAIVVKLSVEIKPFIQSLHIMSVACCTKAAHSNRALVILPCYGNAVTADITDHLNRITADRRFLITDSPRRDIFRTV